MSSATATVAPRADPEARWFAVWTRSQCEPKVEDLLRRKQVEVFVPRIRQPSRRRDRQVVLERPLFPGYVFPRFAPSRDAYLKVVCTEGVVRILGEGWDRLYPIPDAQLDAVRRIVEADARARSVPWIHLGDRVRIVGGALCGLEGFVQDWRPGRGRFVVSIDLLQRSVAVEVPLTLLERV
jgi:transcription antitermination factor NusG